MIQNRPYQEDVQDQIATGAAGGARRIVAVMPTGSGKTIVSSRIISHASSFGKKVLFLAHRRELVWQTEKKLNECGINCGIILADYPRDNSLPVQVGSIQSLYSKSRRLLMTLPPADLLVIDECHHLPSSKTWQHIIDRYPESFILGLTATPINRRGRGLGHYFDVMVQGPSISKLTDDDYLVPARYFVPSIPDLRGIKIQNGDYAEGQLQEKMDKKELIGDVLENWARIAKDRKTIVFATGIKHSIHLAESFNSIGIKAAHVDGETATKERDEKVNGFKNGDIQVLVNCSVFTEGFDCPEASALVFARPTKSLLLYLQVAGRVLRPSPGKKDCFIIDHAGVVYEHGPVDQEWDWKLNYQESNVNEVMRPKKAERKKRQITCEGCKAVYEGQLQCPHCGTKPTIRGKHVESYEAYLEELDDSNGYKMPVTKDRKTWYTGLRWYAFTKNYNPGWIAHKYKEKFGNWPPNCWKDEPVSEPPLDVLAWIKSRQLAYAHSQKRNNVSSYPNFQS